MGLGYGWMRADRGGQRRPRSSSSPATTPGRTARCCELFGNIGKADVVTSFTDELRRSASPARRVLSSIYTAGLNLLFGLNMQYYHGLTIYPTEFLRANIRSRRTGSPRWPRRCCGRSTRGSRTSRSPAPSRSGRQGRSKALSLAQPDERRSTRSAGCSSTCGCARAGPALDARAVRPVARRRAPNARRPVPFFADAEHLRRYLSGTVQQLYDCRPSRAVDTQIRFVRSSGRPLPARRVSRSGGNRLTNVCASSGLSCSIAGQVVMAQPAQDRPELRIRQPVRERHERVHLDREVLVRGGEHHLSADPADLADQRRLLIVRCRRAPRPRCRSRCRSSCQGSGIERRSASRNVRPGNCSGIQSAFSAACPMAVSRSVHG